MSITMTIGGEAYSPLSNTLNITDTNNARSTGSVAIRTDDEIEPGMPIMIYLDAVAVFGGFIEETNKSRYRGYEGTGKYQWDLTFADNNSIADRIKVAETYEAETLEDIVDDIVSLYLALEGVTVGNVTNGSTTIEQAVFNYVTATQAFDFLINAIGGDLNWNIDENKELTFFARADTLSDELNDDNTLAISLKRKRGNYRNVQYFRAGDATIETKTDETPTPSPDGESRTFFVRFPIATKPTIKVNGVAVSDTDVGINGVDTGKKWYWSKGSNGVSQDTTETVLDAGSGDYVSVSYQGLKPIIVYQQDAVGISNRASVEGGTGRYMSIDQNSSIDSLDAAFQYAAGLLNRYGGEMDNTVEIVTLNNHVKAGELRPVLSTAIDFDDLILVTNVNITDFDGKGQLIYTISGTTREDTGTWVDFFKKLTSQDGVRIRENEVLFLIQTLSEEVRYGAYTNIGYREQIYPSDTLMPGVWSTVCGGLLQDGGNVYD